jgi:hypothetical protein
MTGLPVSEPRLVARRVGGRTNRFNGSPPDFQVRNTVLAIILWLVWFCG